MRDHGREDGADAGQGGASEKIQEQKQLQQKFDNLHAEVKELRRLKYAADRQAKGPVGAAR